MRILQVAYGFEGGIGRLLVDYCSRLKNDLEFEFLLGECTDGIFEKKLIDEGFHVHHIKLGMNNNEKKIFYKKFFLKHHYDIIHMHGTCDYICLKEAKKSGIKYRIVHSHNAIDLSESRGKLYKELRKIYRTFMNRAYVTEKWACGSAAGHAMWGNTKFFIMKNAIDIESFQYNNEQRQLIRKMWNIPEKGYVIGSVGRLTSQKNYSFMLKVFANLIKKMPEAHLMLVGDGELRTNLLDEAQKLEIDNKVHITGLQTNIVAYLSAMDVFVLPSKFEGLPVVMIEAQANGLECIVSNKITKECSIDEKNVFLGIGKENIQEWSDVLMEKSKKKRNCTRKNEDLACFNIDKAAKVVKDKYELMKG